MLAARSFGGHPARAKILRGEEEMNRPKPQLKDRSAKALFMKIGYEMTVKIMSIQSAAASKPISTAKIDLFPVSEILHNLVNAPGLKLVSSWVVWRYARLFQSDSLLD